MTKFNIAPADIDWPLDRNRILFGIENNTFGPVRRTMDGDVRVHQGWDFEAKPGTPCYAVANGLIEAVGESPSYGKYILISARFRSDGIHAERWFLYAHLSRIDVRGGAVRKGQQIGLTGTTGNAKGLPARSAHLHFEVRIKNLVGTGLDGRVSPLEVFGICPMKKAVWRKGLV